MKVIIYMITHLMMILMLLSSLVNEIGINRWYLSLPMNFHIRIGLYSEFKRESDLLGAIECLSLQDLLEGIRQLILPGLSIILLVIYLFLKLA